jgi:hypothetical protein
MTDTKLKLQREQYEDDNYTKLIECPIHPAHEARDHHDPDDLHQATLYLQGHRYAGIWECPVTGESDTHEHSDYEVETVEVDDSHPDRSDGYSYQVYVCGGDNGCGVAIDLDEANPAEDRAEALADMQEYN